MGGSGGSSEAYPSSPEDVRRLREEVLNDLRKQERQVELNQVLAEALAGFNDRDVELVGRRLDAVREAIGELATDIDRLLFGGSVAKHTYVDGLSDVDALVVVNDHDASPDTLLTRFKAALDSRLSGSDVLEISTGALAVTITYQDGSQIQLLPAVERDGRTSIASEDGSCPLATNPTAQIVKNLAEVNRANGQAVVPTIKLAKSVLRNLPAQQSGGYHVEAIAVDAFRDTVAGATAPRWSFTWNYTPSEPFSAARDITGQAVHIDAHLGEANSAVRQGVSAAIGRLASAVVQGAATLTGVCSMTSREAAGNDEARRARDERDRQRRLVDQGLTMQARLRDRDRSSPSSSCAAR